MIILPQLSIDVVILGRWVLTSSLILCPRFQVVWTDKASFWIDAISTQKLLLIVLIVNSLVEAKVSNLFVNIMSEGTYLTRLFIRTEEAIL